MPILDHFGILAPFYDRLIGNRKGEWLKSLVELPVFGVILDAGGGTGRIAQLFRGHTDKIVIVDVSEKMLHQAQIKNGFLLAAAYSERLPFQNNSLDRIIIVDALHHVCNHAKTASELWRVLKPGGRLVIEEPDIRTFGVKILAVIEKLVGMRSHFLSPQAIADLFTGANGKARILKHPNDNFNTWVVVDKLNL